MFDIITVLIFIWIIILFIIISKIFVIVIFGFIDQTVLKDLKDYTIGYDSVIAYPFCLLYDFATLSIWMSFYGIVFGMISILIIILFIIWNIIRNIFVLKAMAKWWPFKPLDKIFKVITRKLSFEEVFKGYAKKLEKHLPGAEEAAKLDAQRQEQARADEKKKTQNPKIAKFTNKKKPDEKKTIETFITNDNDKSEYMDNYYYYDLEKKYKTGDNYYINAYKNYQNSKEALLYKKYKVITPDMSDDEITSAILDNNTLQVEINTTASVENLNRI